VFGDEVEQLSGGYSGTKTGAERPGSVAETRAGSAVAAAAG
jgi:hypothetical protein